jgi:membrane associated rhomboid family serine protease
MLVSILILFAYVALLWLLVAADSVFTLGLVEFGIRPRNLSGLVGVPLAPFIHSGFAHVASNTVPMLIFGGFLALQGKRHFLGVATFIIFAGGLATWLMARPSVHVGASGLVFGIFGYLVARGWYDRSLVSIVIAVIVVAFYGSAILLNILPIISYVSWEGHLFGLLAGVAAAYLTRRQRVAAQ